MNEPINRRNFLATSAAVGTAMMTGGTFSNSAQGAEFKTTLHKALIGRPSEKTFAAWKEAGFEGMESTAWNVSREKAVEGRKLADKFDMKIHSVLYGWANFNNAGAFDGDLAKVETALRATAGYGGDALLLVTCRIGTRAPQPWEFDIEFDEKTGHIGRVVKGDNAPYADYIKAHNHATDMSRKAVEKLIPTAEKEKVVIALENVWNNLWVKPAIFDNFIRSFDSPWVQCYFDIGNHTKYAMPEEWIRKLDKTIVKCHVKDFKLNADGHGGSFCNIREGSIDWPLVRKELDAIGYNGWMSIEGSGGLSLQERSKRLDLIHAGE